MTLHRLGALVEVLDVRQAEGTVAVLVALEFADGSSRVFGIRELDHASATRATVRLVLDLGALNLADGGE